MFRGLAYLLLIIGFPLLCVGALLQEAMPIAGAVVMCIGVSMMAFSLFAHITYDWYRSRQARSLLLQRPQLGSLDFGSTYFGDDPARAEFAAKVRDSLASYLNLNLDGLLPDDDLNEVCDAQTDDPSLLWHFEREFQLGNTFEDFEHFEAIEASIRTFRQLFRFLESRAKQR